MNVLVTGACGGIGKAVCEYLLNKNINVYALDVADKSFSDKINYYKADITDKKSLDCIFESLKENNVIFDAIINIAGIFIIDSFIEVSEELLHKIFNVNFFGTTLVNKTFYPLLKKEGKIIITTSEVASFDPMPFNSIYSATKTALDCYAQGLRQELNLLGQKVITIRPGSFNTALSVGALEKTKELTEKTLLYKKQSDKFYKIVKTFMGTPKSPDKIAKTYYKALISKRNKIIYKKHTNFLLKIMSILPKRLQCFIVKTMLKTKKQKGVC